MMGREEKVYRCEKCKRGFLTRTSVCPACGYGKMHEESLTVTKNGKTQGPLGNA